MLPFGKRFEITMPVARHWVGSVFTGGVTVMPAITKVIVRVVTLPGGHHYDGDYAALGALIVTNLPASK